MRRETLSVFGVAAALTALWLLLAVTTAVDLPFLLSLQLYNGTIGL